MGKVYLMKSVDSLYKIGVSVNPKRRIKEIQTGNSNKVELVCEYETEKPYLLEKVLHNRYSHLLEHGEWYILSLQDEIEFKNNCKKIEDNLNFLIENQNVFIEK